MKVTPLGKLILFVLGLAIIYYGVRNLAPDFWSKLLPQKKAEGTVSKDDFGAPSTATSTAPTAATSAPVAPALGKGGRLGRPVRVAIVLWGGYAAGIMANGGLAPNKDSVFSKD